MKLETLNPTTGECLAELDIATPEEIKNAVARSHAAQKSWSKLSLDERCSFISQAYQKIESSLQEMADLIHTEMGKTTTEAQGEVKAYITGVPRLIEEVKEALTPVTYEDDQTRTTKHYDPLGVCASITPWNFPMGMPHNLIVPSLLAGNTVLFKPSEEVPLIGQKWAGFLNEFLPKDVLQVIIGRGEQGAALVESDVQLITFTGSQATGKKILESAGRDLKRVLLELGGKDPLVLLEDADLEKAATLAASNSFRNAGQVCVSTEKILLRSNQKEKFLKLLISKMPAVEIGSMIHFKQKSHVIRQVKEALEMGAKLEYGEIREDKTNRFDPVILSGVTPQMNIMIDETFGPVACITEVKSDEEAVELANMGNYALGAVVFGENTDRARKIARQLNAGMIGVNRGIYGAKGSPWVGAGQSGYGYHGSIDGHRQFTQLRTVSEPK